MGLLFVWLSPEGELLCLPEGSTSGCEGFPIDPKTLPELAFGRVCVTYDCLPIFLALGQAGVSASLRFFDLSRFFRAFYGVKQELPIEEAFTQFGVRGKKEHKMAGMSVFQHFSKAQRTARTETENTEQLMRLPKQFQPFRIAPALLGKSQHINSHRFNLGQESNIFPRSQDILGLTCPVTD